jgi:hypothetical protein
MDDLVVLRGISVPPDSTAGQAFVTDCTRAGEGLISDKEPQIRCELSRGHRRQATGPTLSVGPHDGLDQGQEPRRARGE